MSKSKTIARFFLSTCALALALVPAVRSQQVPIADTSQPLIVKPAGKPKNAKFWGEVLSASPKSIQVRQQNANLIRVFSYSPNASSEMARILAKGGYHYGDKVVIDYAPGSDVALRIKGKPSKVG